MDCFSRLPEGCISQILSLTSPPDVCQWAAISSEFKAAADSDAVWEEFLPSDYREIITRSTVPVAYTTKKQLYLSLADSSILLDGGKMSFALDKRSGKKCYMVGARSLLIAWGDAIQYWTWISLPESRFSEVASLSHVWWLDIRGRIDTRFLSPKTTYGAYLVFKLSESNVGLEHRARAFIRFLGKGGDGDEDEDETESTTVYLKSPKPSSRRRKFIFSVMSQNNVNPRHGNRSSKENGGFPCKRDDGWMELQLGEFFNEDGDDGVVEVRLLETVTFKYGFIVEGIEFRPKVDGA